MITLSYSSVKGNLYTRAVSFEQYLDYGMLDAQELMRNGWEIPSADNLNCACPYCGNDDVSKILLIEDVIQYRTLLDASGHVVTVSRFSEISDDSERNTRFECQICQRDYPIDISDEIIYSDSE